MDPNEGQGSEPQFDGNPSWGDLLNEVPQEYHAKMMPHLQNWDRGVQQQFQANAPWKEVIGSGMDPATVLGAVGLARSMETDPRGVWDAMAEHYGFTPQQMQQIAQQAQDQEEPDPYADRWKSMETMNQRLDLLSKMAIQGYQQQQDAQRMAQEDNELEAQIQEAKKKFGDAFNEDIALQLLKRDFESVSDAWQFFLNGGGGQQQQKESPYAPLVMGSGGNFPQPLGNKRPAQMDDDEQAAFVTQYLTHLQRAKQG